MKTLHFAPFISGKVKCSHIYYLIWSPSISQALSSGKALKSVQITSGDKDLVCDCPADKGNAGNRWAVKPPENWNMFKDWTETLHADHSCSSACLLAQMPVPNLSHDWLSLLRVESCSFRACDFGHDAAFLICEMETDLTGWHLIHLK